MSLTSAEKAPFEPSGTRKPAVANVLTFALRELRSGLSGFRIFIACIALGVAVITGVGALTDALVNGFERQGRELLGGDVTLRRVHKRATEAERATLAKLGQVSETATMRSMARLPDGSDQVLVEIKAVDRAYPLLGGFRVVSGDDLDSTIRTSAGALVAQSLLDRLRLKVGDAVKLGDKDIPIAGIIDNEPDRISARLSFGPRILLSHEALAATGLIQPGTLIHWRYAIAAPDGDIDPAAAVGTIRAGLKSELAEAGFIVSDRTNPSPSITRLLNRLRQFLTLLGLAALLIGGVGVANAVQTFIDRRRRVIATYKSVGATNRMVLGIFLTQIMLIAALGTAIGLMLGSIVPTVVSVAVGSALPIALGHSFSWTNALIGLAYGFLVALLFVLWPLGQAERIRPAALFRDEVTGGGRLPSGGMLMVIAIVAALLVGFATVVSGGPRLALGFVGGVLAILLLFWGIGFAITWLAGRMPRPRRPEIALALTGLAAPGGLTRSVVLSLGAGLSLLVAVALVDAALVNELQGRMPANSPDYFAVDIAKRDRAAFEHQILKLAPGTTVETAPMLRGRIIRLNGTLATDAKIDPRAAWVLRGDRGLTFAEKVPKGSKLIAGTWWDKNYTGEPQVSFVADLAAELGLKLGDTLTVNVLGRNITARITSLRDIAWESLAINFVMVFSPNTLAAAPYNLLATVRFPPGTTAEVDAAVGRTIAKALPHISMIRVKDAIAAFAGVFGQVMVAVRVAASITLIAGALVLAGALATAQRRRVLQAVILKCIGATRRKLLTAHLAEYGLLALVTAAVALGVGTLAAWVVVTQVLEGTFVFSWMAVAGALSVSVVLILAFGLFGTWRVLAAKPVPVLRGL